MEKQHIQDLLKKLSILQLAIKEEEKSQGKNGFNIFRVLHKENDEVRLHSRFISFLLSPKASHNKGNKFLNRFLEKIGEENFNTEHLEVFPTEEHKSEYENIDILLINRRSSEAIIIENKIYAGDSITEKGGQIDRYIEIVKNEGIDNIHVFYLTLWGFDPSRDSYNKYFNNVDLENLSYQSDITNWLKQCIDDLYEKENAETTFLITCLQQYLSIINKLTNHINMEDLRKMSDEISNSKESLQGAKLLLNQYENLKLYVIKKFWEELISKIIELKYNVTTVPKDICSIYQALNLEFKANNIKFYIYHENNPVESLYWGFYENVFDNKVLNDFKHITSEVDENYFRKYFKLNIDLNDNILENDDEYLYLRDFKKNNTFNLINKEFRSKVIDALVKEITDTIKELEAKNESGL